MKRIIFAIVLFIATETVCPGEDLPTVGAIRWDAWTGGNVTEEVERSLGPKQYHHRLPWFAEIVSDNTVRINGNRQEIMDREIELASQAGLNYWAFLTYSENSTMSSALRQYLNSPKRRQLKFCLILHNTLNLPGEQWATELKRTLALLQEPGYQTVLDGRPLIYGFTGRDFPFDRFSELRVEAEKRGLHPYCVFMGWHPAADIKKAKSNGFDAVSSYARPGDSALFSDLTKSIERDLWDNAVFARAPFVPLVTTGWDKNPRIKSPVSWEKDEDYHQQKVFPATATPGEIAIHLQNSLKFVNKHADLCPAKTVIVYAWNEYDEGGWLAPTRGADGTPDNSRLEAVREILTKQHQSEEHLHSIRP